MEHIKNLVLTLAVMALAACTAGYDTLLELEELTLEELETLNTIGESGGGGGGGGGTTHEIIFYEGNDQEQDIVGTRTSFANWTSNLTNSGTWANDEIRSMRVINPTAGLKITVWDSSGGSLTDDYTIIYFPISLPNTTVNVDSFEGENPFTDTWGTMFIHHNVDNLDGKISRIQIEENGTTPQRIEFYEYDDGLGNLEGTLLNFNDWVSNLTNGGTWANDEIRSLRVLNPRNGLIIKLWDSSGGSETDDHTTITYTQDFEGEDIIEELEYPNALTGRTITHHHNNGLNGKVSRIQIWEP